MNENERDWFERLVFCFVIIVTLGLLIWLLDSLWAGSKADAAALPLWVRAPSTNEDSTALTDLKEIVVVGRRFVDTDSLILGIIPAVGMEGDSIPFTLEIAPGSMGSAWAYARDFAGNMSPRRAETVFAIPAVEPPSGGLSAAYHRWVRDANGNRVFGPFVAARVDTTVDFDWGTGSPGMGVPADTFAVRWTGTVNVPTSGTWTLYVSSEDGFRLYVDGELKRDWWQVTFEQEISTSMLLAAGPHAVTLEYFANVGHSACHWRWSGPGVAKQTIPRSALTP